MQVFLSFFFKQIYFQAEEPGEKFSLSLFSMLYTCGHDCSVDVDALVMGIPLNNWRLIICMGFVSSMHKSVHAEAAASILNVVCCFSFFTRLRKVAF